MTTQENSESKKRQEAEALERQVVPGPKAPKGLSRRVAVESRSQVVGICGHGDWHHALAALRFRSLASSPP